MRWTAAPSCVSARQIYINKWTDRLTDRLIDPHACHPTTAALKAIVAEELSKRDAAGEGSSEGPCMCVYTAPTDARHDRGLDSRTLSYHRQACARPAAGSAPWRRAASGTCTAGGTRAWRSGTGETRSATISRTRYSGACVYACTHASSHDTSVVFDLTHVIKSINYQSRSTDTSVRTRF